MIAGLLVAVAASSPLVLAVGVNRSPVQGVAPLEFADDDAAAAVELFGTTRGRTWLLTKPDAQSQQRFAATMSNAVPPTVASVHRAVNQMAAALDKEPTGSNTPVVIWLVGHGAEDERGHPFMALQDGRLTQEMLEKDILEPLSAAHRIHVIIDACHAATLVRSRAAVEPARPQEALQAFGAALQEQPRVGYLLAAAAGQKTYEWNEIRSGVFSALVRAALRGAADADGDHQVTYDEASAYVTAALQGIALPDARPTVTSRPPPVERDAPLSRADWLLGTMDLTLTGASGNAVHVEDARGVWLAGGLFERAYPATLWLPRQDGMVLRDGTTEWELVADASAWKVSSQPLEQGARARGPLERALKEGMFTVPYGPSYWRGYQAGMTSATPEAPPAPVVTGRATPTRRYAVWLALPPWAVAAGALGITLAVGGVGAWAAWQYATVTYQRQSLLARNIMVASGVVGLLLVTATVALGLLAGTVTALAIWLS